MPTMARQWYVSLRRIIPALSTKCVQSTTEEAAKDIAAFVAIFFENFSKFKGRAFHMAGESYGVCLYLRIRPSFTDPVLGPVPPCLCLRSLRPECESYQSRAHTNQFDISYDRKRIHRPLFNGGVLLRYDLYSCYTIPHSEYRVSVNLASRFPGSEY